MPTVPVILRGVEILGRVNFKTLSLEHLSHGGVPFDVDINIFVDGWNGSHDISLALLLLLDAAAPRALIQPDGFTPRSLR